MAKKCGRCEASKLHNLSTRGTASDAHHEACNRTRKYARDDNPI